MRREGSRRAAFALALALIAATPPALASELTDLQGPYIGDGPIAFRASLDYRWRRRTAAIAREFDCLRHEVIGGASLCPNGSLIGFARDLKVEQSTSLLDVDLRLAFYRSFEVRLRLPFVLADDTKLSFDDGVDGRTSLTMPYNAPALFEVPNTTSRSGLADPVIGLWGTVLSRARDVDDPTVALGFEVGVPIAPARAPGTADVGSGAWALTFAVAASDRAYPWLEPFFRIDATLMVPASDALYPDLGPSQATRGPPEKVAVRFGVDLIPFERPDEGSAVRIELGAELALVTSGKTPTALFDALGTSECRPKEGCDLTTNAVGRLQSGATISEEHFTALMWLGAHYDVLDVLRLTARVNVGWESPHFLTASNLGKDIDGRGVQASNSFGDNEYDPDYNPNLDRPGMRYRSMDALLVGFDLSLVGRF